MLTSNQATGEGARLISPRGRPLTVEPEDVLWLLRAVAHEGEPLELVAQTLVNRWAWLSDFSDAYPHLRDLVTAYAQPVNPRWLPTGDLHRAHLEALERAGLDTSDERRKAQNRVEHRRQDRFSGRVWAAVTKALRGPVTVPPGALEYGPAGAPGFPVIVPGRPWTPEKHGVNSIYGDPKGRGLGALYGFAQPGPTLRAGLVLRHAGPHGALAAIVLLCAAAWAIGGRLK